MTRLGCGLTVHLIKLAPAYASCSNPAAALNPTLTPISPSFISGSRGTPALLHLITAQLIGLMR